ncbi:Gfo/Idh/MocA family oxidoreductase, partial [Vibrio parahaemolyticus]|nr:Gfo/Idh/MocA family oxidoreductase [Vibrio parahaemolyticus]
MKIGIIGLGDIAQKAYLPVITQLPNVELVFCTRDAETLSSLAQQYRIKESCQDYRQLPAFGVDAVMIHAATHVHFQIAEYFLKQSIVDSNGHSNSFTKILICTGTNDETSK